MSDPKKEFLGRLMMQKMLINPAAYAVYAYVGYQYMQNNMLTKNQKNALVAALGIQGFLLHQLYNDPNAPKTLADGSKITLWTYLF
jgi:hypothetical protein